MNVIKEAIKRSHVCLSDFGIARTHALIDSTAVGANVIEVVSIEVAGAGVIIVGRLPALAITQSHESRLGRLEVRVCAVNAFHGVQTSEGFLGFLLVQPPITLEAGLMPDDEIAHVAVRLPIQEAVGLGITIAHHGPVCCQECNQMIALERLRAVKNARCCVNCQERKETKYT
jgi:hypothetical protein